jgi:hypothetical protein
VDDAGSFLDDLRSNERFTKRSITRTTEWDLGSMAEVLAVALACFAIEWFIRKRTGMI